MIKQATLKNGMRVITDAVKSAETVSLGVWVSVGARFETPQIGGISHVLEHMAFKGTTTRSAYQIAEEIEDVGGIMNAYTGKDMTAYYVKVLKADMKLGLNIIADILQNSKMDAVELAKEQGVICQEINMQNDTPDDLVFDYLSETAYPDQPLGRPILGTAEVVRSLTSEQLLDYMHTQYTAGRMIISASGAVNHEEFVSLCEEAFGGIPTHTGLAEEGATYVGGDKRVQKKNEQVNLVLGFEGVSYTDSEYYATGILSSIFGGGMSSRLFQEIREKRGLVYSIYAFNSPETDTGIFGIYAGTGEKEVAELMPVLCDEILALPGSITEEELARAKNRLKARLLMRLENISTHAEANAIDMIIQGRPVSKEEVVAEIEAIDLARLERASRRIFATKPTLAALGPIEHVMSYEDVISRLKV